MKFKLENILNSVKKVGKRSLDFAKENAKIGVMLTSLGLGAYFMNQTSQEAKAGVIGIGNTSSVSGIGKSSLILKNISGANELIDGSDGYFTPSPYTDALEIFSQVEGNKLSTDAHPVNTAGWDFDLAVKGSVTDANNYLRYKVVDTTDLLGKTLTIYDKANPSIKYDLLMDGEYHNISLPNLTFSNGEYANWRMDIPEPSTIALLSMGLPLLRRKRKHVESKVAGGQPAE